MMSKSDHRFPKLSVPATAFVLVAGIGGVLSSLSAHAGDWPQVLGPKRNGVSEDERLAESWPKSGPPVRWARPVGKANAGVAIAGNTGVLFHRLGDEETIEAFDTETGQSRWKQSYPTSFVPQVGSEDGPLCVPSVHGDKVVTFGAQGVLTCCELTTGKPLWQRQTHDEFEALSGYFGAGSSPLVWEDRVIVNVGGHKTNAGVVAFSLQDGRTLWQVTDERASYAAPIAMSLNGQSTIVCLTRMKCLGLDPANGNIRFEIPFGKRGPTVNAAAPLSIDGRLFLTASYGIGALWADISPTGASELWRRRDVMSSQYTTPIQFKGHLYGIDGREDGPPADLKCIDPATGKAAWTEAGFGYASLVRGGDRLLIAKTSGELLLVRPSPNSFQPLSRHQLTSNNIRALPALSNGRLYIRDTEKLYCLDVGCTD